MEKEIRKVVEVLQAGGTIVYPTDTVWGIGCDATNKQAVAKIYRIKNILDKVGFIILASNTLMLKQYVKKDYPFAREVAKYNRKPLTIIYPHGQGLSEGILAKDSSVAIRIPDDIFCQQLIARLGRPIVSTSANLHGMPSPLSFNSIETEILSAVDYIVDLRHEGRSRFQHSTIIKVNSNNQLSIIRA